MGINHSGLILTGHGKPGSGDKVTQQIPIVFMTHVVLVFSSDKALVRPPTGQRHLPWVLIFYKCPSLRALLLQLTTSLSEAQRVQYGCRITT